jgi:hypothetical protein
MMWSDEESLGYFYTYLVFTPIEGFMFHRRILAKDAKNLDLIAISSDGRMFLAVIVHKVTSLGELVVINLSYTDSVFRCRA